MSDFTGQFRHSLDAKGRLILPAGFRERLGEDVPAMISIGLNRCLVLYPKSEWASQLERLKALPRTDQQALQYKRVLLSSAHPCEIDAHGRLLIPSHLREQVGIVKDVVVTGNQETIEVWDRHAWDEYYRQGLARYESNAGQLPG